MTVAALVAAVAFGGIVLPHLLALQRADPATACLLWAAALGPARARRGRAPWPARSSCCIPATCCAPSPSGRARRTTRSPATPPPRSAGWRSSPRCCGRWRAWCRRRSPCAGSCARRWAAGPRAASSSAATTSCSPPPASPTRRSSSPPARSRASTTPSWRPRSPTSAPTSAAATATCCSTPSCAACSGARCPGTARAVRQLRFHIERDADRSAVRERADRLALASAICKAATGATTRAGMAALGGDGTAARVRELLQDVGVGGGPRGLRPLAVAVAGARGGRGAVAALGRQRARRSDRALRRVVVRSRWRCAARTASSRGGVLRPLASGGASRRPAVVTGSGRVSVGRA